MLFPPIFSPCSLLLVLYCSRILHLRPHSKLMIAIWHLTNDVPCHPCHEFRVLKPPSVPCWSKLVLTSYYEYWYLVLTNHIEIKKETEAHGFWHKTRLNLGSERLMCLSKACNGTHAIYNSFTPMLRSVVLMLFLGLILTTYTSEQ